MPVASRLKRSAGNENTPRHQRRVTEDKRPRNAVLARGAVKAFVPRVRDSSSR